MEIIQFYIGANEKAENGIQVTIIRKAEVTKSKATYAGQGLRLKHENFEKLEKAGEKLGFYVWTTNENAKPMVIEAVKSILKEFEERDAEWEKIKRAMVKAKAKIELQ